MTGDHDLAWRVVVGDDDLRRACDGIDDLLDPGAVEAEEWRDARIPVVSNVTGEPVTDGGRIRAMLAEQVRSPVEWVRCVERMVADGVDTMVECGSGSALVGMVKRIAPEVATASVGDASSLAAAVELVAERTGASVR